MTYSPAMRLALAVLLALALTACGGGDSDPSSDPTTSSPTSEATSTVTEPPATSDPTTEPAPEPAALDPVATVQAWVDAYNEPDGAAACALQTPAYTKRDLAESSAQGTVKKDATCEEGVVAGNALATAFGVDFSKATVKAIDLGEERSTVELSLPGSSSSTVTLVLVDGTWLIDDEKEE